MADPRPKFPSLEATTLRSWTFVLVAGVVLAVIALIDGGGLGALRGTPASTCPVTVSVADGPLSLREGPSTDTPQSGTAADGSRLDATTRVEGTFRQLTDGRWASDGYLVPDAGATC